MEMIIKRKKNIVDLLIIFGTILLSLIFIFIVLFVLLNHFGEMFLVIIAGVLYGAYYIITSRNIEFEYSNTNGEIDIDKIIAQRKRKRIFNGKCKDFEILANVNSVHFNDNYKNNYKTIDATSRNNNENVYFMALHHNGERTVVLFEPSRKMLESMKMFNPRNIYLQ